MNPIQEVVTDVQVIRYLALFFIAWSICLFVFLGWQENLSQKANELIVKIMIWIAVIGVATSMLTLGWLWLL